MRWGIAALLALALASWWWNPADHLGPGHEAWSPEGGPAVAAEIASREPCALVHPRRQAFFGDLHVHTGLSMDTVIRGGASTPDEAYRFARGDEILLPAEAGSGGAPRPVRLERALDFAAVTDHAEWLGETSLCRRPGSPAYESEACRTFRGERTGWLGGGLFARIAAIVGFTGRNRGVCGPDASLCRAEASLAWRQTQAAAERHYDRTNACSFTSFHAWEYSASPGRSKVHRNVILRNEIAPELPISWIDEPTAEGLWRKLGARCNDNGSGCEALVIPHNPNVSNGKLFAVDRRGSMDEQRARARLRARMEPLVEMMQAKGESECRDGFEGVLGEDELCALDKVRARGDEPPPDCGSGTGNGALGGRGCQSRLDFARYVLAEGLVEEERIGVNPYRHGWIGSTDTHNGTPGATDEASYPGHNAETDASLAQRLQQDSYAPQRLRSPGGLVGIWAEQNTREALFVAMKRRETFATSGTRIVPRFFGGFELALDFCQRGDAIAHADAVAVPMGGILPPPSSSGARPRFAISALADPGSSATPGALLQRLQVVKVFVDETGLIHQEVVDVAGHAPGEASVDRASCARSGPGERSLCGVWSDPGFDPGRPAAYYARVVENPSCRWSTYQCLAAAPATRPAACDDPSLPWKTQERAWTSAIWYAP